MILPFKQYRPKVHPSVFVAPGADVIGRVELAKDTSVWFGCVLRGDVNRIVIGEATNIQDGSILHVDDDHPCLISDHVHVGHHVNLHGCRVESGAMIGIGAIVLSGARVGKGAIVGAGSVVLEGTKIPAGMLAVGVPAKVVRRVSAKDQAYIRRWVNKYVQLAKQYRMNTDAEVEDFILANSPRIGRLLKAAERDLAQGRTVSLEDYLAGRRRR